MDSGNCQTLTASPAEPGELSCWLRRVETNVQGTDFIFSAPNPPAIQKPGQGGLEEFSILLDVSH
jgi:hypothetical protein